MERSTSALDGNIPEGERNAIFHPETFYIVPEATPDRGQRYPLYDRTTLSDEDIRSGAWGDPIDASVIEDKDIMMMSFIVLRRRDIVRPYNMFLAVNAMRIFVGSDLV